MVMTYRDIKGAQLTPEEADENMRDLDARAVRYDPVVAESTTARTSTLPDAGKLITFNNAGASTYTIEPHSSVPWAPLTEISVYRNAAGSLELVAAAGVTIKAGSGGTLTLSDGMAVMLKLISPNSWILIGQTVPL